jgi:hypothetical protein
MTAMISIFSRVLKRRKLKREYEMYYASLTSEDKEDEIRLFEEFQFSDREVELFLKNKESTVRITKIMKSDTSKIINR